MDSIAILLQVCSVILGLAGGAGVVWKVMLPKIREEIAIAIKDLHERISAMNIQVEKLVECNRKDYARMNHFNERDKKVLKALHAILTQMEPHDKSGDVSKIKQELVAGMIDEI